MQIYTVLVGFTASATETCPTVKEKSSETLNIILQKEQLCITHSLKHIVQFTLRKPS